MGAVARTTRQKTESLNIKHTQSQIRLNKLAVTRYIWIFSLHTCEIFRCLLGHWVVQASEFYPSFYCKANISMLFMSLRRLQLSFSELCLCDWKLVLNLN